MRTEERYMIEIAKALAENHAAVMIGAGFSKNAEKIGVTDNTFLSWNQLSDLFYEKIYGASEFPGKDYNNSLRLAQEAEIMIGRPGIEEIIKQAVPDDYYAPSDIYLKLMELPWKDVFTTNYDTLLERSADLVTNRRYDIVVSQEDLINSGNAPRIVKLHGSLPSHRPFIITEEDYRTYPEKFAAMVNTVQQSLLENIFCMLGFSCEDPNFTNWIGWIHDHLGKSSSQKIYMVTVLHVPEAKQRLYFERNIILVDLETLWPDKDISERLLCFFDYLKKNVDNEERKRQWFDWSMANSLKNNSNFSYKTDILRKIRHKYPGWIFIPWELKKKINNVMNKLDFLFGLEKISLKEKIEYMYEHVKIFDLGGRPLYTHTVETFYNILLTCEWNKLEMSVKEIEELHTKEQTIYLHIMRALRELSDWERFEICRNNINIEFLSYEEKQFFYAEECRTDLFRFHAQSLSKNLEKWRLSKGDVYWPLIKGNLLALIGEMSKAEELLADNLIRVRRQLTKNGKTPFLVSIEECNILLINFIRQNNYDKDLETYKEDNIFWRNTNEKYCLSMRAERIVRKEREEKCNFNLSKTYTIHMGNDNTDIYLAMEYWRFYEQTGYSFKIGNVVSKEGLEGSIKRLYKYYPYWSLIQILNAQEEKCVDYLLGRSGLASQTMEQVDKDAREYLGLFRIVCQQVKVENSYWPKSIYEQASGILPEILSRFCYKCSVNILDEMIDLLLELCLSGKYLNFKNLDVFIKGVVEGYTLEEQENRIEKILQFPIESNRLVKYIDPVSYVKPPVNLYKLSSKVYNRVILQIRQELESVNPRLCDDGLSRFINLKQIVRLEKTDEDFLYQILESKKNLRNEYILYALEGQKDKKKLQSIVEGTLKKMIYDAERPGFSSADTNYTELIWVMRDIHFCEYDILEWFQVMTKLVNATVSWIDQTNVALERIRQSCIIAQGILISLYRDDKTNLTEKEQEVVAEYRKAVTQIWGNVIVFDIVGKAIFSLGEQTEDFESYFWICNEQDIDFLTNFVYILIQYEISTKENGILNLCLQRISEILIYRLMNADLKDANSLLMSLLAFAKYECISEKNMNLLGMKLEILLQETQFEEQDGEEESRDKLFCRIGSCTLASELYKKGFKMQAVLGWKLISESKDEFIEIRRIDFEKRLDE